MGIKKVDKTIEKLESRFGKVMSICDKFSDIKPSETLLTEKQLLDGVRTGRYQRKRKTT